MAAKIKKGDTVQIIAGDNKGSTGKVLRVIPSKNRVLIQGLNMAKKHVRQSRRNPQGGRISVEQPIHISNVLPVSTKSNKAIKVRYRVESDGAKKRVGVDGAEIGLVRRGRKK